MRAPLLVLLLAGLPLVATAQDPKPGPVPDQPDPDAEALGQPVRPRDIYGRRNSGIGASLDQTLQGCWKLVSVTSVKRDFSGATLNGYLIVHEGFLAFEMQAFFVNDKQGRFDEYQTFFTEYKLEDSGLLSLSTLTGSWLELDGFSLSWEEVGYQRRMQVEFPSPNVLELTSDEGGTLSFVRRLPTHRRGTSIFGTPRDPGEGAAQVFGTPTNPFRGAPARPAGSDEPATSADPSGRGAVGEDVERDIFGRPVKREAPAPEPPAPEPAPKDGDGDARPKAKGDAGGGS